MRVAVVGGGVSGLAAAQELAATGGVCVTVYEKEDYLGGCARTVAVDDSAGLVRLDLCSMVFSQATCPNMTQWLDLLGVEIERSEISFSVSTKLDNGGQCDWSTSNGISSLLAQKSNALRPSFWCMIREILKFKTDALRYLEYHENNPDHVRNETLGQFIQLHQYSDLFQEAYLATCPNMTQWLDLLGVEIERSEISFSVSTKLDNGGQCDWSTSNGISSLLAQKSNALRPSFWCMIREILKFKTDALRYLEYHENNPDHVRNETLGQFIQLHQYSDLFQEAYLATCPNMTQWLDLLGVEIERSEISFSVSTKLDNGGQCDWSTSNGISSLLAQKSNALRPSFWCMIREILKFKTDALRYLEYHENNPDHVRNETLGQFIQLHQYSDLFQEAYLIPICASVWSCPSQRVLGFSAFSVLSFFHNHDLFQLFGRPESFIVKGRLQSFVDKVRVELESMGCQIKTSCTVKSVFCHDTAGCRVQEEDGSEEIYDNVILAIHPPAALKILGNEATNEELRILGAFQYVYSDIYLHCDKSLMPQNLLAWSPWNFLGETSRVVFLTYWLNPIQNIQSSRPFLVTINPPRVPDHILHKWSMSHHVPSVAAVKASIQLDQIQGKRGIWYSGAYQGHGFHEYGLKAGKVAAQGVLGKKADLLVNPKQMVPSWTEAGARLLVAGFLNRSISVGNLILLEDGGSMLSFGDASGNHLKSVLRVHDPMFYWKVATEAHLGLAYPYINGWCSSVDKKEGLLNLFLIFIANRDAPKSSGSVVIKRGWWTPMLLTAGLASAKYFLRHTSRKNSVTQTRRNISQHYDLSNDLFSLFLDKSMTYSCGIFKTEDESLEAAQIRKLNLLIDKAKVERDHHVLDIGSGWGGLAIQVVKQTGCKYTGITLSAEQLKYAQKKVQEAGLEDHITFLLCDYRQIPARKYDRIISCEMIEHVGHEYLDAFFTCCESHLAQGGIFVLQAITMPDELYEEYVRSPDFIKEYIFPGGSLPSLFRITSVSASARLCIEHLENINGDQYYLTLRSWRNNLIANKDEIFTLGFDDKFILVWEYYFIYCAAGFRTRILGAYQIVFSRPGNDKLALA